jgi:hypothetical protein
MEIRQGTSQIFSEKECFWKLISRRRADCGRRHAKDKREIRAAVDPLAPAIFGPIRHGDA